MSNLHIRELAQKLKITFRSPTVNSCITSANIAKNLKFVTMKLESSTIQKCIRIPTGDITSTNELAAQAGCSFSDVIRDALRMYLQNQNEDLNISPKANPSGRFTT